MAAKSDASAQAWLRLLFLNQAFANVGDAAGLQPSAAAGDLYMTLHTATPGATGDQTTNEVTYGGYSRVAMPRDALTWTVSGPGPNKVVANAAVNFPVGTGGGGTATYFGIGTASAGAGTLLYYGPINAPIPLGNGKTPTLATVEVDES